MRGTIEPMLYKIAHPPPNPPIEWLRKGHVEGYTLRAT